MPSIADRSPHLAGEVHFEGKAVSFLVEEDGTVLVELLRTDGTKRWLRTPANQSSTTQFELLALHTLLASVRGDAGPRTVVVHGETSTELDGEKPADAMRLMAIGWPRS
ncbi:MAG: hypothetical protein AB8H80_13375 [Planctomycetota bacterium]